MSESSENSDDSSPRDENNISNPESYVGSQATSVYNTGSGASYPHINYAANPLAYKEQKQCFICETQLGKSNFTSIKKLNCKFCYNAVCSNCSPLASAHPLTHRPERICMKCYNAFIEEKSIKSASSELKLQLDQANEKNTSQTINIKLLESKCNQLEKDLEEKDTEYQEKLNFEIKKINDIKETELLLEKETVRNEVTELEGIINDIKAELERNKENFNEISNKNKQNEDLQKRALNEKNEEIEKLRFENAELKRKIEIIQTAPKANSCGCIVF